MDVVPLDRFPGARSRHPRPFCQDMHIQIVQKAAPQRFPLRLPHGDPPRYRAGYTRLRHPAQPGCRQGCHAHQLCLFCSCSI